MRGAPITRALLAILALGACSMSDAPPEGEREGAETINLRLLELDLERMIYQSRYDLWEASAYFPDGKVMRHPPEGTVSRTEVVGQPALTQGIAADGDYVARIPVPLSMEMMKRGQERFGIYCAPCHGLMGDGDTHVARVMQLRPPPSLVEGAIALYPPGRIYQVIDQGYGLMRSYAADLPLMDRWAVIAYVQALQRAEGVALDSLPPPVRARALTELP